MTPTHDTQGRYRRGFAATTAAFIAAATLTGCGTDGNPNPTGNSIVAIEESDRDGFQGTLVDPPFQMASVSLRDTNGNPVRLDEFPEDKATAVFFGFTNCPDICPTTIADLAAARQSLSPELAERVAVYFVTVDPKRDTPKVLTRWLASFGPGVIGLRGSTALVNRAERSLYAVESDVARSPHADDDRAAHTQEEPNDESSPHAHGGDGYEVNHSGSVYVFGTDGETLLYSGGYTVDQYAADFTRLLKGIE